MSEDLLLAEPVDVLSMTSSSPGITFGAHTPKMDKHHVDLESRAVGVAK